MEKPSLTFEQSKSIKISLSADDQKQIAQKDVIEAMCRCEGAFAYDILLDGKVIGFALFRSYNGGVFLWQYAIASEYQGRGYGYEALKCLIKKLNAEKHITYFTTTYTCGNTRAPKLYEKLGFTETDTVDEDGVHEVNMELVI